jgi:hypothetical protein
MEESKLPPLEGKILVHIGAMTTFKDESLRTLLKRWLINRSSKVPEL